MVLFQSFFYKIKRFFQKDGLQSPEEQTLYVGLVSLLTIGVVIDISAILFFDNWVITFKLIVIHLIFFALFIGLQKKLAISLLQFLSIATCVLGLASFWFETNGLLGSVCFYFWVVIILGNTLLPVKYHPYSLSFTISIIFAFSIIEYNFPSFLQNPYPSELSEKIFSLIMLLMGTILCGTITSYFKNSYIKYHKELEQKNIQLSKTNQELDNLIYSISHDLRAPIVSLMGLVSLHKTITDNEEAHKYIELEERSLDKLDKFIQDLLAYSRVNRAEVQFKG